MEFQNKESFIFSTMLTKITHFSCVASKCVKVHQIASKCVKEHQSASSCVKVHTQFFCIFTQLFCVINVFPALLTYVLSAIIHLLFSVMMHYFRILGMLFIQSSIIRQLFYIIIQLVIVTSLKITLSCAGSNLRLVIINILCSGIQII